MPTRRTPRNPDALNAVLDAVIAALPSWPNQFDRQTFETLMAPIAAQHAPKYTLRTVINTTLRALTDSKHLTKVTRGSYRQPGTTQPPTYPKEESLAIDARFTAVIIHHTPTSRTLKITVTPGADLSSLQQAYEAVLGPGDHTRLYLTALERASKRREVAVRHQEQPGVTTFIRSVNGAIAVPSAERAAAFLDEMLLNLKEARRK